MSNGALFTCEHELQLYLEPWASAEIFPGEGKVDILLIFSSLLAMQRKWTYTKNVQCYGNSYIQCFPYKKILHRENVFLVRMDISRLS